MTTVGAITADQAARALVAAARKWGVEPMAVFEPTNRGVRVDAVALCLPSRPGQEAALRRVFRA